MKNKILIMLVVFIKFFTSIEMFSCNAPTGPQASQGTESHEDTDTDYQDSGSTDTDTDYQDSDTDVQDSGNEPVQPPVKSDLIYTLSQDETYYEVSANRERSSSIINLTIPATYNDKPVAIAENAFKSLPQLTTVNVERAHGNIGANAFYRCPKLTTVQLKGDGYTIVNGFIYCDALKEVTLGEGIYSIGTDCFYECKQLERVVIGDDCVRIGTNAFQSCTSLRDVTLGKGLEIIAAGAFRQCTSLTSIDFPTVKTLYLYDFAFEYSGLLEIHIPANLRLAGQYAFGHVAWDDVYGYSRCKAIYFYSKTPTVEYLGTNSIGYTWDRTAMNDPVLGDFKVYVPADAVETYRNLMRYQCDESWARCVLNTNKLATFTPQV